MAFKLPKEPIRNRKEFLLYLLATACGVGLALGLERAAEWWKTRSLVAEARRNLAVEISDTRSQLANWRQQAVEMNKNMQELADFVEEMIAKGSSKRRELKMGLNFPTLTSAAWRAAEATGAAGHMNYAETKRYAQFYDLQSEYRRLQSVCMDELAPLFGFFSRNVDPTQNQRREDMERLGRDVRAMMMRVKTMDSLAQGMDRLAEDATKEQK